VLLSTNHCVSAELITADHLHALLKRLSLERETVLSPASTDTKEPALTLDKYLDRLAAQNYLEKVGSGGRSKADCIGQDTWSRAKLIRVEMGQSRA